MSNECYKIKTNAGWFYTVSQGRYGRFGTYEEAHAYCGICAQKIAESFTNLDLEPEILELKAIWRFDCQNEKHNDLQDK